MRIGRTFVISAILTLGVAGSVLAGAQMSAAATSAPSVHLQQTTVPSTGPDMKYHN
jgi:hypothetical protein